MDLKDDLAWNCVWPMIEKVRGKNNKMEIYSTLNEGQKALFSFYSYFNHANKNPNSFMYYTELYHRMGFLKEIKAGLEYFKNKKYVEFIEGIINDQDENKWNTNYNEFVEIGNRHIVDIQEAVRNKMDYYRCRNA